MSCSRYPTLLSILILHFLLLLSWCSSTLASDLRITSESIIKVSEREPFSSPDGSVRGKEEPVVPLYQYLEVEYGDLDNGGLSFHAYGWGRKDLAGSDYYLDDPDGELLYGYLEYSKPYSKMHFSLGRRHVFSGVTNQSVDGLMVTTGLGNYFSASAFGGLPSAFREDNGGSGDYIYGGRIAHHLDTHYEIGLSYQKLEDDGANRAEKAGSDVIFHFADWLSVSGLSSYNLDSSGWREHRYSAQVNYRDFQIEPSYQHFRYQDYFDNSTDAGNLFKFLTENDEIVEIAGADLMWQATRKVQLGVRGRHYNYDLRDESAEYYGGLLVVNATGGHQVGFEIGRMDGQTPENIYDLYRSYLYWQDPLKFKGGFLSADVLYIAYDEQVYGKDDSLHFSLSGGYGFFNNRVETKLSGLYSRDPFFDQDIGAIINFIIQY